MRSNEVTTLSHESIEQFRNSLSVRGRSAHTTKSYASDLRMFLQEVGTESVDLSQLEERGMEWLTAHRMTLSPKTTTRRLTSLRAFARWAGMRDLFLEYSAPTPGKPVPKPVSEGMAGVRRMIEAAQDDDMKVIVGLCGLAGLRISEALSIAPYNVNFQNRTIEVRGKGDKTRTVPMSDELKAILVATVIRRQGLPTLVDMADRVARARVTRLGIRAGLKYEVSSHMLRATFATQLMIQTKDLRLVQEVLGHSSSKTTEGYTLVTLDRQRDAVNDL